MKILFATFLVFAAAAASGTPRNLCNPGDAHEIISGDCGGDILYEGTLIVEGTTSPLPIENKRTIEYPETGSFSSDIKCIRVLDLINDGTGGCPIKLKGGKTSVVIEYISQKGKDMKFSIKIA